MLTSVLIILCLYCPFHIFQYFLSHKIESILLWVSLIIFRELLCVEEIILNAAGVYIKVNLRANLKPVTDPRNRQRVSCNRLSLIHKCYRRLIACFRIHYRRLVVSFLDPLQETCCLFLGSLYSDNFSLISYFRAEGGLKRNFHLVYDVQECDIFHI